MFKKRQDLISWTIGSVIGEPDILDIFVEMNKESMPDLVLLIGKKKIAREMAKDKGDVKVWLLVKTRWDTSS